MSDKIISYVSNCLKKKDLQKIKDFFEKNNLSSLNYINQINFLNLILIEFNKIKPQKNFLECIFDIWVKTFNYEGINDLIGVIFSENIFEKEILRYILDMYSDLTTFTLISDLIEKKLHQTNIVSIFNRMEDVSNIPIKRGEVFNIIQKAGSYGEEFFKSILNDVEEYGDVPVWIGVLKDEENLDSKFLEPENWDLDDIDLNYDTVSILKEDINNKCSLETNEDHPVTPENVISVALSMCDLFQELEISEEKSLFANRIFGPRNSILGEECSTSIKGGCRMLSCKCFVSENYNPEFCDGCLLKIRDISHSIRYPLRDGGWSEEHYCGMDCMTKNPPRDLDDLSELRIDRMVDIMEEYGIYNRIP